MDRNIVWQNRKVSYEDRCRNLNQQGMIVWLTGLSGSGKSTIAVEVEKKLQELGKAVYLLDGDNVRHGLNQDLGFSDEDRNENIRRVAEVAALFADAGLITLVSFISPFEKMRQYAREKAGDKRFVEVYVKADIDTCIERDPKGLYRKNIENFTGKDSAYEEPSYPELVLDTTKLSVEECAKQLMEVLSEDIYAKELQVAKEAAKAAGAAIMEIYDNAVDMEITYKDGNMPLTAADKAANRIIVDRLKTEFPQYAILSEEEKDNKERLKNDFCFVVDPLDGTKEFIKRNGQFTVNIALSYKNKSVMGVIYVPVTGELYYATRGHGAYLETDGRITRLHVSDVTEDIRVVASNSHNCEEMDRLIEKYNIKHCVNMGSSLKGCVIARGEAECYYRFNPTMEWDTAAMQCITEEAGAVFRQMDNSDMCYNRENSLNDKGFYIINSYKNKMEL